MNTISRTISGIASIILGLYISFDVVSNKPTDWVWGLIVGVVFIVIGVFIFFNKKEDDIEEIKK